MGSLEKLTEIKERHMRIQLQLQRARDDMQAEFGVDTKEAGLSLLEVKEKELLDLRAKVKKAEAELDAIKW